MGKEEGQIEYIKDRVENFLKTPAGKRTVREWRKKHGISAAEREWVELCVTKLKTLIMSYMPTAISSGMPGGIHHTISLDKNGDVYVSMSFDPDVVFRPSLAATSKGSNYGVRDIVLLFTKGYSVDPERGRYVRGMWHGHMTHALLYRAPNDFLQRAVDEFNATYGKYARAELKGEYTGN